MENFLFLDYRQAFGTFEKNSFADISLATFMYLVILSHLDPNCQLDQPYQDRR
jgi:hypothetical protein